MDGEMQQRLCQQSNKWVSERHHQRERECVRQRKGGRERVSDAASRPEIDGSGAANTLDSEIKREEKCRQAPCWFQRPLRRRKRMRKRRKRTKRKKREGDKVEKEEGGCRERGKGGRGRGRRK